LLPSRNYSELPRTSPKESNHGLRKKAAKKAAPVSRSARSAGAFVTLTNGSFYINGEAVYVSEDAEIEVPVGAVISGSAPV
jgi:uncharacterized protein YigE (DUF2233 family)